MGQPRFLVGCIIFAITMATASAASDARADLQLDVPWRQSALTENFTVQEWLPSCGPEPSNTRNGGGEDVRIRQEGDELVFVGGGRTFRTNQCYDPMPTLTRESHGHDSASRSWRTRCTAPATDGHRATVNTLVVATSDTHIDVIETGRYEITNDAGRCVVDVKRRRSFNAANAAQENKPAVPALATSPAPATSPAALPTAPSAEPKPKSSTCDAPGEPARLEVRPSRKLLRTGESFSFRARVMDENGCMLHTPTTWQLANNSESKGVAVSQDGNLKVAPDAREGIVDLVATAADKSAHVTIEITDPSHYDDLLARSGLNASGENDAAAVVTIGAQSLGAGESSVEDRAKARRLAFLAIVGATLAVLSAVAAVLARRARKAATLAKQVSLRHELRMREAYERQQMRIRQHDEQQRAHDKSVLAAQRASLPDVSPPMGVSSPTPEALPLPNPELMCSACGRIFNDGTRFCPYDGVALRPKGRGVGQPMQIMGPEIPPRRGKICPTCGDRFEGSDDFCGKDGTQLVLFN